MRQKYYCQKIITAVVAIFLSYALMGQNKSKELNWFPCVSKTLKDLNRYAHFEPDAKTFACEGTNFESVVKQADLDASYHIFTIWLLKIFQENPVPKEILGMYFGLTEYEDAFGLYVVASKTWDKRNPDWAVDSSYQPKNRNIILPIMRAIHKNSQLSLEAKYYLVIAVHASFVRAFFNDQKILRKFRQRINVGIGYSDGDVYNFFSIPDLKPL